MQKSILKMTLLLVFLFLRNAVGLEDKKATTQLESVQNTPKNLPPIQLRLDQAHEDLIKMLDNMGKSTQYEFPKIKEILEQSEEEWLKVAHEECVALVMLISPKASIENSPIYKNCYEAYVKQRIHDLYDFYIEGKKVKRKIKKAHKQEVAIKQSQPLKKEPPKSENKKSLVKPNLKDTSIPKGYYLQIGAFLNAPSKDFLQTLKTFPYQIKKKDSLTHYFIGPYKTKEEALKQLENALKSFKNKPVLVEK
ncbi:SPOR domain-containing protein [Helicobacter pylori]|uniref:SPOR domain-containing protein n=1 Tax=Helicobacter pylori TaxID=210 RepID=UPI000FDE3D53|nr:SPOR domain-containing protein [Helicobacter pylori]RVY50874.1 SPOR domain-containing protein [Helicobacter pylori]